MTLKEAEILALTTLRQASGKVPFLHIFACQSFAAPQPAMYYNFPSLFIYDTRYIWLYPGYSWSHMILFRAFSFLQVMEEKLSKSNIEVGVVPASTGKSLALA